VNSLVRSTDRRVAEFRFLLVPFLFFTILSANHSENAQTNSNSGSSLLFKQLVDLSDTDSIPADSALKVAAEIYRVALSGQKDSLIFQSVFTIAELFSQLRSRDQAIEYYFLALKKLDEKPGLFDPSIVARKKIKNTLKLAITILN
jgi:hypothetical protein